jgi:hypothetical protein
MFLFELLADKVFETVNMNGRKLRLRTTNAVKTKLRARRIYILTFGICFAISVAGFFYFTNPDITKASNLSIPSPNAFNGCFAAEVVSYTPQKRLDGSLIPLERRNAQLALGQPQNIDALNFVSLGFGGEMVLKFQNPIAKWMPFLHDP